jgi:hypothetical protein
MKFPKKIYVNEEVSIGSSGKIQEIWYNVQTDIKYIDENIVEVAIYELKEVKILKVTRELK